MWGWSMAFCTVNIQHNICMYFVLFSIHVSVYGVNSVLYVGSETNVRPLQLNWFQFERSTDLAQWDARCCSGESHRCSGGVLCSDSYSAHPQAGRPEYTRLPWMWWHIFVLEKIKKKSEGGTHERRQLCDCYVESKTTFTVQRIHSLNWRISFSIGCL